MAVYHRPNAKGADPDRAVRGWISCDAKDPSGTPCLARAELALAATPEAAEQAAADLARAAGRVTTPAGDSPPTHKPKRRGIRLADPATLAPVETITPTLSAIPTPRYAPDQIYDIPVQDLMPDPHQPRKLFDPAALAALAESLKTGGQQHPCRFRERLDPPPGTAPLILVDGERRWRAAQIAGLPSVRAVLDSATDSGADLIVRQALLNEPGAALRAWDWVLTFNHLARAHQLTPAQIAAHLGARGITNQGRPWSRPQVANYLRLLELPAWAQDLISDGPLTPTHGLYLLPHKARPEIMAHLRQWLESTCRPPAAADPPADGEDPPPAEPSGPTVANLRSTIGWAYAKHHLSLDGGWNQHNGRLIRAEFNWRDPDGPCHGCAQHAVVEARSYCCDHACFESRNAAHRSALAQDRAAIGLGPEPDGADPGADAHPSPTASASPAADPRAGTPTAREARAALAAAREAHAAEVDGLIKVGLFSAGTHQLEALLLWHLLRREYLMTGQEASKAPQPAAIAEALAGPHIDRWLRSRLAHNLERSLNDTDRRVIADYLNLTLPDAPTAPVNPLSIAHEPSPTRLPNEVHTHH